MEKYKASSNEDVKSEKERAVDNNANNIKNLAEVAKNAPHPYVKAAGHAVSALDKMTGGKSTKNLSKIATKGIQNSPGGNLTQSMLNKASESGASDAVGKVSSMKNGQNPQNKSEIEVMKDSKDKYGGNNSRFSGLKSGINKATSTNGDLVGNLWAKMPPSIKIKVAVGCGVALLFLLMVTTIFAADDNHNLSLTNNSTISSSSVSSRKCSAEEVENKLLYVGDSRTVGMQSSLDNENIGYIAESGKGYDWFNSTALSGIETKLQEKPDAVIVLSLGVNDLYNIDNYITAYKSLIAKYPSNNFYILSVNPVDESKTGSNGYTVTNADIETFNKKLADNFPNNYIDSYSSLTSIGTSDGLHYDNETYKNLNGIVTSNISSSGKVMCSSGIGNFVNYYQYDYTESYGYGTTIASAGCGPTSMAMVLTALTGKTVTPVEAADWSLKNGHRVQGEGTSWAYFPAISKEYGLVCETLSLDTNSITTSLSQGKPIIISMGPPTFTSNGHFIVLTGITSDGKITVADPNSEERSGQTWDVDVFINEGSGGLWAFSK